jgi:hypothetical protein
VTVLSFWWIDFSEGDGKTIAEGADILGDRAAVPFANALKTTHSTLELRWIVSPG